MTTEVTTTEAPEEQFVAVEPLGPDAAARLHLGLALGFLVLATVLAVLAAIQLVVPEAFTGAGFLIYGRLLPVATSLFLYGWLTLGMLGAIYFILPRVTGIDLVFAPLARGGGVIIAVGVLAGSIAVGFGASEGRELLEMPLWADAIMLIGLGGAARSITATIEDRDGDQLSPVEWYFGAAPIWLILTIVVGNIPGLIGVNSIIQSAFYRAAFYGLWLAAAGVGIVYYLIPTLSGSSPGRASRMTAIGFWSLGLVWALTGLGSLTYSAAPDWAETLGVMFAILLLLPVLVIFADIVESGRGRWGLVTDRATLRLVMAGAVLFLLIPILTVTHAFRASNLFLGFTQWVTALDWVAAYGAFTLWTLALLVYAAPTLRRGAMSRGAVGVHLWGTLLGLALAVGAMLIAGLQAGFTWTANANGGVVSAGNGFRTSVTGLEGWYWVRFIGIAVFALAQLVFVIGYIRARREVPAEDEAAAAETTIANGIDAGDDTDAERVSLTGLRLGTVGLFLVAATFGLLFPTLEASHITNTQRADESRYFDVNEELALGRNLYLSEGCWYCHTQEVRQIVPDAGLGPVSQPGDYAWEVPAPRGVARIGPDLFVVGSREPWNSPQEVVNYLFDPQSVRSWTMHPSYQHLSDAELTALALYISNLE